MRVIVLTIVLSSIGVSALFGQVEPNPKVTVKGTSDTTMDWGSVKDGRFVSDRLGLTLSIPTRFIVPSAAEAEVLGDAGNDLLKKGVVSEKRFDEAATRTIKLLALFEKPVGLPENSGLELVAAKQASGVTANMSLSANLAILKGSPFSLTRSLSPLKLGSNTFASAELEGLLGQAKFKQRMYVIIHKGYSLVFVTVYSTEKQKTDFEQVISTLSLR